MGERVPIEETELFLRFDRVSDWAWGEVVAWDDFGRKIVGSQMIRALDSIVANLVEGDGRYRSADALNFFVIARGSARESKLWIGKAIKRGLVSEAKAGPMLEELEAASRQLNRLIQFRRSQASQLAVKEDRALYGFQMEEAF